MKNEYYIPYLDPEEYYKRKSLILPGLYRPGNLMTGIVKLVKIIWKPDGPSDCIPGIPLVSLPDFNYKVQEIEGNFLFTYDWRLINEITGESYESYR